MNDTARIGSRGALRRWIDIATGTARAVSHDNCTGLAAQLAFYFLLALFPALLFLVALISYLPIQNGMAQLIDLLGTVTPHAVVELVRTQLEEIKRGDRVGLLTIGFAGALWSSSAALVAIIDALNRAYHVPEWRAWWKRRLVAIGLTLALAVFIALSLTLILIGPDFATRVAQWVGAGPIVPVLWAVLRWPTMVLLVVLAVDLLYYFAPNRREPWRLFTPGSVVSTALWILSSFAFKWYVTNFADYNATYGAIGGVIVLLLWLYVSGLAILVGAELNFVAARAARSGGTT